MTSKSSVRWTSLLGQLVPLVLFFSEASAQTVSEAQPAVFLRGNDSFAFDVLKTAHTESPDRNVVIAPLPVSLTFAAVLDGTGDPDSIKELDAAFHFDQLVTMPVGAKMILARFERPKPYAESPAASSKRRSLLSHTSSPLPPVRVGTLPPPEQRQELWLSAAFLYRRGGSLSPDFIGKVTRDFGIPFHAVGERTPQSEILARNWDPALPSPKLAGPNDFWITSFTHLRTSWAGNTFVDSKRQKHDFQLRSGKTIQADFLKSETEIYPYAHTEEFEAVVLTCQEATILLVLPSVNSSVEQLERAIADRPNLVEALLMRQEGDVRLPPFHLSFETDLRTSIEAMGVHRIFTDPHTLVSLEPRNGAVLTGVAQKTEIAVDENGIRADAGTVVSGVLGGITQAKAPFHMSLDRPFLFFIRDRATNALLFEGAVMDPTLP
jgi:serine protease inhibitor